MRFTVLVTRRDTRQSFTCREGSIQHAELPVGLGRGTRGQLHHRQQQRKTRRVLLFNRWCEPTVRTSKPKLRVQQTKIQGSANQNHSVLGEKKKRKEKNRMML